MDKAELKKLLKPLMKECIREVLMENGLQKMIAEAVTEQPVQQKVQVQKQAPTIQKPQINENQKKMIEEIRNSKLLNNKFDPFAGTSALTEAQAAGTATGPMSSVDPNDPGVDISNLMNGNKKVWKALVGGKG